LVHPFGLDLERFFANPEICTVASRIAGVAAKIPCFIQNHIMHSSSGAKRSWPVGTPKEHLSRLRNGVIKCFIFKDLGVERGAGGDAARGGRLIPPVGFGPLGAFPPGEPAPGPRCSHGPGPTPVTRLPERPPPPWSSSPKRPSR
jgi:hypothetical protein